MNSTNKDNNRPLDYLQSQGTASIDIDNKHETYSENIERKGSDMKEYPTEKTSFKKINYVQK